jgi:hypothetical protein
MGAEEGPKTLIDPELKIVLESPAEKTPVTPTPLVLIDPEFVIIRVSPPSRGGLIGPWVVGTGPSIIVVSASANCGNEIANAHKTADLAARVAPMPKAALPIILRNF